MSEMKGTREPVPIRNKDIMLLSRVLYTMQDVSITETKRMWLQDRLWNITQKITGLPSGHGLPAGMDAKFAAISEMEEKYHAECDRWTDELLQAENILNSIPSESMRTFVTMRYVLDMNRKEISDRLNIRRWQYEKMCTLIEQAQDMAHVDWKDRFILQDNCN